MAEPKPLPAEATEAGRARAVLRAKDILVLAMWAGLVFGVAEGVLLDIARFFPVMLAPYKASARQLYVAPIVDVLIFAATVPVLMVVLGSTRRLIGPYQPRVVVGTYLFLGASTVLVTMKLLHPAACMLLALGVSVSLSGMSAGREFAVVGALRRHVVWIPITIALFAVGVSGWSAAREFADVAGLSPVVKGTE